MKQLIILLFAFIITASVVSAQNYGLGNTDPSVFTKFKIPETIVSSAWVDTRFSYTTDKIGSSIGSQSYYSRYNSVLNLSLSPKYWYLKENDVQQFSFNLDFSGQYDYYDSQQNEYDDNNKNAVFNLNIGSNYSNYFVPEQIFYSVSAKANVNINDQYQNNSSMPNYSVYNGTKEQNYDLSFGIGFGKIRNVTPVVSAIRMQERLKQLNLLNNDLSENIVNDLAKQFSRFSYYDSVHVRSEKYFWGDLEDVLVKDGISLKGLNEYGSAYLHDVIKEVRFLRREGMTAGINFDLNYSNHFSSLTYNNQNNIAESFFILANAFMDYSHQLSLNSQIRSTLNLIGGPDIIANSVSTQQYNVQLTLGYDYELTDRFVMSVENSLNLSYLNRKEYQAQERSLENDLSLSFNYFIEDQVSLNATYILRYNENRYVDQFNIYNNNNIVFGVSYYIGRGFIMK